MTDILGIILIIVSILCSYYASSFKRINYLFGLISYLIMGYIAYKNHVYGLFVFNVFVFAPMQLIGYINWGKNQDKSKNVIIRTFSTQNRFLLIAACIVFSLILAAILNIIPGSQFTYLDSFSNIINLSGVVLMTLRFNESWWLWLINNIIDLILWTNILHLNGDYSVYMFITSIIYLAINVYGLIKWEDKKKIDIHNILKVSTKKEIEIISYIANTLSIICYIIIGKKVAIFAFAFAILQSLILNRVIKDHNHLKSILYLLISIIGFIIFKPAGFELIIMFCLLLYSIMPMIKNDNYIRIIGLINIVLLTVYDVYIKLYNLVFLDVFMVFIFIYGVYYNSKSLNFSEQ